MAANGTLRFAALDHAAQEDSRRISWSGGNASSAGVAGRSPIDLQRETNGQLSLGFDYSLEKPAKSEVVLAMECGAGCKGGVPITRELQTTSAGQWRHLKIPLACFAKAGTNMSRIWAPFVITTAGELELGVGNIRLETGNDGLMSCAQ